MKKLIVLSAVTITLLTACGANWQREVNLTDQERLVIEKQIAATKATLESGALNDPDSETNNELFAWIEIARGYEQLGNLKKAVNTYEEAKKIFTRSEAVETNLANLYREVGLVDKAIDQYLYVIDTFASPKYYNDVAWLYAREKSDLKQAEFYVKELENRGRTLDPRLEQFLSEMRQNQ